VACQGGAVTVDAAGGRPDGLAGVGGGFGHVDAVDRTHRYAEVAAGALVGNDGVHLLGRADDGIGRADLDAARAADAFVLADEGDFRRPGYTAFFRDRSGRF